MVGYSSRVALSKLSRSMPRQPLVAEALTESGAHTAASFAALMACPTCRWVCSAM
jgi:hypothetical protein